METNKFRIGTIFSGEMKIHKSEWTSSPSSCSKAKLWKLAVCNDKNVSKRPAIYIYLYMIVKRKIWMLDIYILTNDWYLSTRVVITGYNHDEDWTFHKKDILFYLLYHGGINLMLNTYIHMIVIIFIKSD